VKPYLENTHHKNRVGGVFPGVDPKFGKRKRKKEKKTA
jgi:hypothetical protein